MKKLLFAFAMTLSMVSIDAQIKTPAASPSAKVMQTVGLTDVEVTYSRPSMKGRTIFSADGLVPFGDVWRTGANRVTKVSFSGDIMVEGAELKGGDYAVLSIPGKDSWAVHFYNYASSSWSSYVEAEPAAIVNVKPMKTPATVEDFTIDIRNMKDGDADLVISWENTMVALGLHTDVDGLVMENIERVMAGPTPGDYYTAATYYHNSGRDLKKALEMIKVATDVEEPMYWQVRRKALILADLGMKKEAIEAATLSKELAMKAGKKDYVRMNEASIEEWSSK
jgi:hypothetical protein